MKSKFETWLQQNGAEILPNTNQFEWIRFKGSETGVIYTSGKYSNEYAKNAFECYKKGRIWDGRPINHGRNNSYKSEKISILKRDGNACFYCGNLLEDDITLEHLISLVSGGPNTLANMVLAHEKCNNKMENKPLHKKVDYAIKSRIDLINKEKDL